MKKTVLCVCAALLALGLAGCNKKQNAASGSSAAGRTFTLKMSTQLNETHPMVDGFKEWAKNVEAKTGGGVTIQVYPSAQLGSDEDVIEQALQGVNVAVLTDGGRMGNYVQEIGIIGMPYIVDNYDELLRIMQTNTFAEWEQKLVAENDIRVLAFNWYDGPRHFLTNDPVRTPADLKSKGLRIRTPGAPVWARSVEAMGATPIAMGWNDSYNAIQSKSIDGVEAQHTASFGARLYEVVKYINKTGHFQLANGIIVGEKWFSRLPADYQKILIDECQAAAAANARVVERVADEYEQQMVEKGMVIVEADQNAFKTAADSAYTVLNFASLRDRIYAEMGK
ncbi:MAG: C4-dicarboxylate TRAP transporter substrate-binding protein [Spirochaetaceae bacterium]|jgi:TRAP-type C4-dicarboxylate transport system substrate-binding protein|nr:C4-dicarboxylate TRAP transporter substrate-binding protein [Spirochaetaceae bacterium]